MIKDLMELEVWFVVGSQHLYGKETLTRVEEHAKEIAREINDSDGIPVVLKYKCTATDADQIRKVCMEANHTDNCIGLVTWMHTFSPAKMWISGLKVLHKPMAHLHTQFNLEIPWDDIDMDFMNLNQSAHGDREFGYMVSRLRKNRKVITGHWQEKEVQTELGNWCRVAAGWHTMQKMKIARIGDNMRDVAVTEGDKVESQMRFGFSVNGYGVGDLVTFIDQVSDNDLDMLLQEYADSYHVEEEIRNSHSLKDAARIELGLRAFLKNGDFEAFTDTFENLHGLKQLPGISVQRLMQEGYGFGAEGDWKTAALLRAIKVMDLGLPGGSSFMEDYTYDFKPQKSIVLGSHMLEICPSIADSKPRCEVHPLSIGGREDPARLIFNVKSGPAINICMIDLGSRFRLLANVVDTVDPERNLPKLPVARALWNPKPNLKVAATAWILGGGSHHTVFSQAISRDFIEDLAEIAGVELLIIDENTTIQSFKDHLHWNDAYYHIFGNQS